MLFFMGVFGGIKGVRWAWDKLLAGGLSEADVLSGWSTRAQARVGASCAGALVGYPCFILPEEKSFSTYYKIVCQAR